MGKWSDLPAELVMAIEENVALYVDKVRFRSVCLFWNSSVEKVPNQQEKCFPWLLQTHDSNQISSHGLFNPIDQRIYELYLPNSQGKIFKGSSHGWVISVEEHNNLYLINPLNGTQIKLPPRTKFPDVKNYRANKPGNEYGLLNRKGNAIRFGDCSYANINLMEKIVLSSPPSHEDCMAIAIYGEYNRLAYCKHNDSKWTFLFGNYHVSFVDLIFHKGKLHALTWRGEILVFETVSPKSEVTKIVSSPTPWPLGYYLYLVESSDGGLIMVARHVNCHAVEGEKGTAYNTSGFIVYKHNPSNSSWFVVKNIGDDVLFLGFNSSFSISSSSCPFTAYKKNHIYFTDNMTDFHREDNERGGDLGVFNLEDESIESLPGFKCPKLNWPPPVWVTPTPRQLIIV